MSRHTIHSYRDTLVLLLRFLSSKRHCGIEHLDLAAITTDSVGQFLTSLEQDRHAGHCEAQCPARRDPYVRVVPGY